MNKDRFEVGEIADRLANAIPIASLNGIIRVGSGPAFASMMSDLSHTYGASPKAGFAEFLRPAPAPSCDAPKPP